MESGAPDRRAGRALAGFAAAVVAAVLLLATASGADAASSATAAVKRAQIAVATTHTGPVIGRAVFGSDFLAPFGGMGSFDAAADRFWPAFTGDLDGSVYAGSLRFPGGITGESYQWQRAVGPQSGRSDNPVGPSSGPSPSTVGPGEFGELLDKTGATGVMTVNFGTGTAQGAAALVQYMTGAAGSSRWADERVADGHPAPYDVPYWEVGNEEYSASYWRSGTPVSVGGPAGACSTVATCEYIYGGTTSFSQQRVVQGADRTTAASVSTGAAGQSFEVAYPPVVPGTATIAVGGTTWSQVASLRSAGPSAQVYTLDPATGTITFGDGTHGAVPPAGETITASYHSGPHDGFEQFYAAMKRADPGIHVCSSDTSQAFIDAMGSKLRYDCLQEHPYVSASDASPSEPLSQYEAQVMGAPDTETTAVQTLRGEIRQAAGRSVPLVLSEYGQLINSSPDPLQAPYYLNSLDEALINASQLAAWIRLGIPVADRQLLDAELPGPSAVTTGLPGAAPYAVTGAIVTPGPTTIVEPTGEYLQLMSALAGGRRLAAAVSGNPQLTSAAGAPVGDLSVVAAATSAGVELVAINRSPDTDVASTVHLQGVSGSGRAAVTTLDGPSALSDNSASAPHTVSTTRGAATVTAGRVSLTLPAHSISLIAVPGL